MAIRETDCSVTRPSASTRRAGRTTSRPGAPGRAAGARPLSRCSPRDGPTAAEAPGTLPGPPTPPAEHHPAVAAADRRTAPYGPGPARPPAARTAAVRQQAYGPQQPRRTRGPSRLWVWPGRGLPRARRRPRRRLRRRPCSYDAVVEQRHRSTAGSTPSSTQDGAPLEADNGSVPAVAQALLPSTVQIIAALDGEAGGATGSGFVLDREGHIVTNNHVVASAAEDDGPIKVVDSEGVRHEATVVGRSPVYDLAILSGRGRRGLGPGRPGRLRSCCTSATRSSPSARPWASARPSPRASSARSTGRSPRRRVRQRLVLHQRGADRRGDQPRQLRWPARQPRRRGRGRQLRHRHHRRSSIGGERRATSASASPSRSSRSARRPTRSCAPARREYPVIGAAGPHRRRVRRRRARLITEVMDGHPGARTRACRRTTS